jgi:hypothetical protein
MVTASAGAQEGHPLTGVWYGDWGASANQRNDLTVIMAWDGKAVTGTVNPGPDAVQIRSATLDSSAWTVRIEFECRTGSGASGQFVGEGKLENIGSYNRTITGSATCGTTRGDFRLRRD